MRDEEFLKKYEELLDKGYCNCNEMNCIDNNSPRRILNIVKRLQLEEDDLLKENCILKLCLISLLEKFEKTEKSINDNNIKRYFKDLQKYIRKCLKLESKNNYIWDDLKRGDTNE